MLGNPNAQRIPLKKTFCSKMLKINRGADFEQTVFLSAMRCALGFPNIKSSYAAYVPHMQLTIISFKIFCFLVKVYKCVLQSTDKIMMQLFLISKSFQIITTVMLSFAKNYLKQFTVEFSHFLVTKKNCKKMPSPW